MTTILLVEDNEMNRDMLSRRLARKGYAVLEATDGQQGIDKAKEEKPDLILMDMSLPVIDGWEATKKLKADEATKDIPVIALTAHARERDRVKSMDVGCQDFFTKPVDLPSVLEKIRELLGTEE